jgi:hypothetical protein
MRRSLYLLLLLAFGAPVTADVTPVSCLHADLTVSGSPLPNSSRPLQGALSDTVEQLRRAMRISARVVLVGSSTAGVAMTSPPCFNTATGAYVITVNDALLIERENQLKGASIAVLAHELGHVMQFSTNRQLVEDLCANRLQGVKELELLADFASGYAIYKTQRSLIDQGNNFFVQTIASLSDYAFTNEQHHGTVTERMDAFGFGEAAFLNGRALDMAALMRNSAPFMQRLAGPKQTAIAAGASFQQWIQQSLDEVYR